MVRLPRNEKQTYWLISRVQLWPSVLTLTMTLTLNFQGQIWNFLYLSQKWSDCHKTKSNILTEPRPQMWLIGLTLTITLTFEFWGSNVTLMVKFWNSCISEWEGRLTLHKWGGSMSFMTMTMTIWWPRSGVWIYQIVTGVTSVVGVPSTHLVYIANMLIFAIVCKMVLNDYIYLMVRWSIYNPTPSPTTTTNTNNNHNLMLKIRYFSLNVVHFID